ncbi:MAG: tRNA (adenosine(37)-N6)-threonylcarbamoyltransferase complex dimerization subunit type 1 TsaB [Candidatus Omnitrophica bacterium]|nr:tRNA (adenosine(37)-N6)-threonylcarbamoyltransferase complex dimerization subunit type 1 TsaB [Candidatus Omnitrophota bacterium]
MKIISIETTTKFGSIAFLEDKFIKKEVFFESSDIAGEIVEKLDIIYDDFDYIIVSNGPGSWTGIRLGISFAKGLVLGNKDKIYCVNLFESLFYSIKDLKDKFLCIVPFVKDKFYFSEFKGRFNYKKSFKIKKIGINQLISIIKKDEYFLIGPGVLSLKEFINVEKIKKIDFLLYPRASLNGIIAYEKIKRKIKSQSLEPIYGK